MRSYKYLELFNSLGGKALIFFFFQPNYFVSRLISPPNQATVLMLHSWWRRYKDRWNWRLLGETATGASADELRTSSSRVRFSFRVFLNSSCWCSRKPRLEWSVLGAYLHACVSEPSNSSEGNKWPPSRFRTHNALRCDERQKHR